MEPLNCIARSVGSKTLLWGVAWFMHLESLELFILTPRLLLLENDMFT